MSAPANKISRTTRRQAGLSVRPRIQTRRNMSLFNAKRGYQGRREICCEWRFLSAASRNGKGKIGGDLARPAATAIAAIRLFKVNERGRRAMAAAEQWVWRRRRRWERERRNEQSKGIKGLNEGGRRGCCATKRAKASGRREGGRRLPLPRIAG